MNLPFITVYSHDSTDVGPNGPTYQRVEYHAALRAVPNILVLRPVDVVRRPNAGDGSRQPEQPDLPDLLVAGSAGPQAPGSGGDCCARDVYLLAEAEGVRRVTLIGTGSEVALALAACNWFRAKGDPLR